MQILPERRRMGERWANRNCLARFSDSDGIRRKEDTVCHQRARIQWVGRMRGNTKHGKEGVKWHAAKSEIFKRSHNQEAMIIRNAQQRCATAEDITNLDDSRWPENPHTAIAQLVRAAWGGNDSRGGNIVSPEGNPNSAPAYAKHRSRKKKDTSFKIRALPSSIRIQLTKISFLAF